MGTTVAVAGASGYAGGELLRLLAAHPHFEIAEIVGGPSSTGQQLGDVHPQLPMLADRVLADVATLAETSAEVVFLALPHGASAAIAAQLPAGVRVLDLGADHRLTDPATWERAYGGPYAGAWPYGLPELPGAREQIAAAQRVAVPGCYPTAVTLGLRPLLDAGLVDRQDVVVVAASGTSGAGRSPKVSLLGSEVMGDMSAYKVGRHQHVYEMMQALGLDAMSFTPVLAPLPRGMLATITARTSADEGDLRAALQQAYDAEPFVHVLGEGRWPHAAAVNGSNAAQLQVTVDEAAGRAVVVSVIDNLGKGASGQAVQCANLMLGLDETTGLSAIGVAP
jgi:N-acetyl-gamma-glutamyl-phosphate reductase